MLFRSDNPLVAFGLEPSILGEASMTQLKMPEPVAIVACSLMDISIGWNQAVPHNTKLYTTKALRDVLEQAALVLDGMVDEAIDDNEPSAVTDYFRRKGSEIRAMKEQIV